MLENTQHFPAIDRNYLVLHVLRCERLLRQLLTRVHRICGAERRITRDIKLANKMAALLAISRGC